MVWAEEWVMRKLAGAPTRGDPAGDLVVARKVLRARFEQTCAQLCGFFVLASHCLRLLSFWFLVRYGNSSKDVPKLVMKYPLDTHATL